MDKIVLLPNKEKDLDFTLSKRVLHTCLAFCSRVYTDSGNRELIEAGATPYSEDAFPRDAELLLVLGGDGTMLHAAETAVAHDIPLLGVNIGRLGYLASLEPTELASLSSLAENAYAVQERMLLDVGIKKRNGEALFLGRVLNDVVIDGQGHLADLRLFEKESYIDYRADGLIVATPTGSTAYSLSAGGPVLEESMGAICVTPICPRSFFSRSLLFSEDASLNILNMSTRTESVRILMDGCTEAVLNVGDSVTVSRSSETVRILSLKPRHLLEVLSKKMNTQHF
jgi:NAD+ kinase